MTEITRRKRRRTYYRKLAFRTDLKARRNARMEAITAELARQHWAALARQGMFRAVIDHCATVS